MNLVVDNDEVRIECAGLEYLNLKSALYGRIGSSLKVDKNSVSFPTSCLLTVLDLLPPNSNEHPEIAQVSQRYAAHELARSRVHSIVEQNIIDGVPDAWTQLLDPPQSVAVSAMTVPGLLGLCLFDEQGSGKTVMTISAFDILKSNGIVDAMIVICPKSMLGEWPKDINRFLPGKYSVETAEGDRRERYQTALRDFDVLATNYEGVEYIRIALSAATHKSYLLVVDESYYLKNSETFRSDAAAQLRTHCTRCFVLCGTPAPNSAYDLINQFDLADRGYTFQSFKKSPSEDVDRTRISDLVDLRGTFIRRLKTDVLQEVPDKNFHVIRVPLTGRQALMYERARRDLELELRALDNSTFKKRLVTYFQKRAALLQICSCPASIDPTVGEVPVKLLRLDALLQELISQGRKVILWSFFRNSLDELANRYSSHDPLRIDGSIDAKSRAEAVRLFQEDPQRMLFIANPAAAGAGITLHASHDAVYVSYSNQAAHYLQSLDRIHRRGQVATEVNYYLLVCEGTIEETEVVRLRRKELQQHSLLGDHITWPTSLDEALSELSQPTV